MKTDLCSLVDNPRPMGKYQIKLSKKALHALSNREFAMYVSNRIYWVEDGFKLLIEQMMFAGEKDGSGEAMCEGKISDYFRLSYPDSFPKSRLTTETNDQRRTPLLRIRFLLRCLRKVSPHYMEFTPDFVAGLRITVDVFIDCLRQVAGEKAAARFKKWAKRFWKLWDVIGDSTVNEEAVRKELEFLLSEIDIVFEGIREDVLDRERREEAAAAEQNRICESLERLAEAHEKDTRTTAAALRQNDRLVAEKCAEEPADPYSRLAGLERLNEACRIEVMACIRYSHEKGFRIARGDKSGAHSLKRLAELVWKANQETFDGYARLKGEAGYMNIASLAGKLYKLAQRYPQADHFLWVSSSLLEH